MLQVGYSFGSRCTDRGYLSCMSACQYWDRYAILRLMGFVARFI